MTKQNLIDKINSYKGYNQEVKDRVLKQIPKTSVSQELLTNAMKSVPKVMKAVSKHLIKVNKVMRRVEKLERHAYAPEMNCLHLKDGVRIQVPQKTTIEDAVELVVRENLYKTY